MDDSEGTALPALFIKAVAASASWGTSAMGTTTPKWEYGIGSMEYDHTEYEI